MTHNEAYFSHSIQSRHCARSKIIHIFFWFCHSLVDNSWYMDSILEGCLKVMKAVVKPTTKSHPIHLQRREREESERIESTISPNIICRIRIYSNFPENANESEPPFELNNIGEQIKLATRLNNHLLWANFVSKAAFTMFAMFIAHQMRCRLYLTAHPTSPEMCEFICVCVYSDYCIWPKIKSIIGRNEQNVLVMSWTQIAKQIYLL